MAVASSELKMLAEHARQREELHEHHATSRPLSDDYELVGLVGEYAFQLWSGLEMDLELRPGGDCKFDFVMPNGLTIDIKTAKKAYNLFREEGKPHADILVLAGIAADLSTVTFYGWEYGVTMVYQPTRDFGHNILNHYKRSGKLRSMHELKKLIATGKRPL